MLCRTFFVFAICVASFVASVCCKLVLLFVLQALFLQIVGLHVLQITFAGLICKSQTGMSCSEQLNLLASRCYGDEQLDLDRTQGALCSRLNQPLWRDNKRLTAALHLVLLGGFGVNLSCPGGFRGQPRCRVQGTPCLYVWSVEQKRSRLNKRCVACS